MDGWSADGSERWLNWVVRRREDRLPVGYVQATVRDSEDGPIADVAWVVGSGHQGKGYAKDAARLMLDWLRGEGVRVVTAHIHPEHAASQAVARSLGLAPTETVHDGEVRWIG